MQSLVSIAKAARETWPVHLLTLLQLTLHCIDAVRREGSRYWVSNTAAVSSGLGVGGNNLSIPSKLPNHRAQVKEVNELTQADLSRRLKCLLLIQTLLFKIKLQITQSASWPADACTPEVQGDTPESSPGNGTKPCSLLFKYIIFVLRRAIPRVCTLSHFTRESKVCETVPLMNPSPRLHQTSPKS